MLKTLFAAAVAGFLSLGVAQTHNPIADSELIESVKEVGLNIKVLAMFGAKIKSCKAGDECPAKTQASDYLNFAVDCMIKYSKAKSFADKSAGSELEKLLLIAFQQDRDSCIKQLRFHEESLLIRYNTVETETRESESVPTTPTDSEIEKVKKHTTEIRAYIKKMEEETWYSTKFTGTRPATFKEAIEAEKSIIGKDNPFWIGHGGGDKVCSAMKAVKLSCDYNTRITLSMFLTVNGKGLFPASGKTNPYVTEYKADDMFPDDGFIGHPPQNEMLAKAVIRNAKLFKDGDIAAEAVKKLWK